LLRAIRASGLPHSRADTCGHCSVAADNSAQFSANMTRKTVQIALLRPVRSGGFSDSATNASGHRSMSTNYRAQLGANVPSQTV
jgi:hypothetical protein